MPDDYCQIIAEAGVNHNGSIKRALDLIDMAADAGADVVKFQTFRADLLATGSAPKADYQIRQTGDEKSQSHMLKELELDEAEFEALADHCVKRDIEFMSTPFDEQSIGFLTNRLNVQRLKVSSGDITNGPMLLSMAQTGLPIILSSGMSTLEELEQALGVLAFGFCNTGEGEPGHEAFANAYQSARGQKALGEKVTLFHCTSAYPAALEDINLRAMDTIKQRFGLSTGYSDHTQGITVAIAAAARGATMIEKHITLDKSLYGPDHAASLEPHEFQALVQAVREVSTCLGRPEKQPTPGELQMAKIARRSLHAARNITIGECFGAENIAVRRPGTGRSPMDYWSINGKKAERNYKASEVID